MRILLLQIKGNYIKKGDCHNLVGTLGKWRTVINFPQSPGERLCCLSADFDQGNQNIHKCTFTSKLLQGHIWTKSQSPSPPLPSPPLRELTRLPNFVNSCRSGHS